MFTHPFLVTRMNVLDELKDNDVQALQEIYLKNANRDAVVCLNLTGEINIGMIIRSASNFSMGRVIIIGKRSYDRRAAVGMQNYIPIEREHAMVGNHNEILNTNMVNEYLAQMSADYQIIFVEQGGISITEITKCNFKSVKPVMFILGTEQNGIPDEILQKKEELGAIIVSIPQTGIGRSFNVSNAFAIVGAFYYIR